MHGEQGALIATAKIVGTVPDMNAKFYAATQVMDEARHVEAYKRLLHEKFELAYPINPALKTLLEQTLSDRRWDMTYLGMQVLIEGLALAAFQSIRDKAGNTLAGAVNAYVMQDEARHVSFGRLALRDYYPQLSDAERDEREEFVVEALYFMRDRFNQSEVWERLGLPAEVLDEIHYNSKQMNSFRGRLFSRVVPTVKDIGLWGERVRKAFADMGVMDYAKIDVAEQLANDGKVAEDFDRKMFVEKAIAAGVAHRRHDHRASATLLTVICLGDKTRYREGSPCCVFCALLRLHGLALMCDRRAGFGRRRRGACAAPSRGMDGSTLYVVKTRDGEHLEDDAHRQAGVHRDRPGEHGRHQARHLRRRDARCPGPTAALKRRGGPYLPRGDARHRRGPPPLGSAEPQATMTNANVETAVAGVDGQSADVEVQGRREEAPGHAADRHRHLCAGRPGRGEAGHQDLHRGGAEKA